ncbi:MAG TPA: SLBB domain-containing protein [Acidimicrobiales bacterium]|nr:SLBB domain-containing protein [Acidimicrobiales bacterium]
MKGRLLARRRAGEAATSLAEHRRTYMPPPPSTASPRLDLIETIEQSGLTGRGGGGFPTAKKLRAVAQGNGPRVVLANGAESEPASQKDQVLMSREPHLVLDGAALAAAAVGASEVRIGIDRAHTNALFAMRHAVAERLHAEPSAVPVRVFGTPSRFVTGEETALVQWMDGGPGVPRGASRRPFERGVSGSPTLVQNVETLAHMTQIGAFGSGWFRALGTSTEPGTCLVTITGAVKQPGVIEAPIGTSVSALLTAAGGHAEPLSALLIGGFYGTWAPRAVLDAAFSRAGLAPHGANSGAGVIVALPANACGLSETARVLSWFAAESAGQCGPCVWGLADVASGFASVATATSGRAARPIEPDRQVGPSGQRRRTGVARPAGPTAPDLGTLVRWADDIEGRGACRHPDGAVRLLRSALRVFADDLALHLSGETCSGGHRRVLTVPTPARAYR